MSPPSSWCIASPAFPAFEIFREDHSNMLWGSPGTPPGSLRCWEMQQSIYLGESVTETGLIHVRNNYRCKFESIKPQFPKRSLFSSWSNNIFDSLLFLEPKALGDLQDTVIKHFFLPDKQKKKKKRGSLITGVCIRHDSETKVGVLINWKQSICQVII